MRQILFAGCLAVAVLAGCGESESEINVIAPYQGDVMVSGGEGDRDFIEDVPRVNLAPTPFAGLLSDIRGRGVGATPVAAAPSGGVVGVDEEIEGVGSSEGQVMSDGSGESPDQVVVPGGAVSSPAAVSAAESVAGNHAMATVVPVQESERAPIVEATAVAARERFSETCEICESAEGSSPEQRAVFFHEMDYGNFVLAGNYSDWVDEGRFINVPVAVGESESVPCEEGVVGNSFSSGQNPTLNNYSHTVYVFVEREGGRRGCVGLSKDTDLNDIDRNVLVGGAVNSWRPESMDVALEFLTDEKRSNSSVAYSRLPLRSGETAGFGIPGEPLLCGPDQLPLAFWDDRNGFYAVSNDDRLELYPRASDENAAGAVGTGWFFVVHTDETPSLVDAFCWRVPNWPDVPVRRCPICQVGLR